MSLGSNFIHNKLLFWSTASVLVISIVVKSVTYWQERRKRLKENEIPTVWRHVGEIDEMILYPLKSGGGTKLLEADCTEKGLRTLDNNGNLSLHDRTFMVYNEESGSYMTALQKPKMVLIRVSVKSGKVIFSAPGIETDLHMEIPNHENKIICNMWSKETVSALDCGDQAALWMSECILGKKSGLRLGYSVNTNRDADKIPWSNFKKHYKKIRKHEDYGIFSDLSSFMLLGKSSVDDLNTRIPNNQNSITAGHFRPNIMVKGTEPYEEDTWDWVKLGDQVILRSVKPCARCTFTTIDPRTGIMDLVTKEPLKTLKTYRGLSEPAAIALEGDSPVMGLYLGLHTPGLVKQGDRVYVGLRST